MAINQIIETIREEQANDAKFWRNFVYFFELIVPTKALSVAAGDVASLLFPLVMNPTSISMSEPFTLQDTPGLDGGLVIEENGIIRRMLHIEGTTGFAPRRAYVNPNIVNLDHPSFNMRGTPVPVALSGQRHMQFLQDRVFRTYGDLKRDPNTAADTKLIFHNPKDDEHWLVAPREFRLDRDASKSTLYRYAIDLLVLDRAQSKELQTPSEDKGLLDTIKDTVRAVRNLTNFLIGAVKDVIGLIKDVENFVHGITNTLKNIINFIGAASDLISGAADLIAAPFTAAADIIKDLDNQLVRLVNAPLQAKDTVVASFRKMQDAMMGFMVHPDLFETPTQTLLRQIRTQGELITSTSAQALADAAANPPTSLADLASRGSAPLAGDQSTAAGESGLGRNEPLFTSADEHVLEQTDSLPSLAARYLGDARRWRQIAVLNSLRPPFITTQAIPGTRRPGDRILIPSTRVSPQAQPGAAIIGARPTDDLATRLLGVDLHLVPSKEDPRFLDIEIAPSNMDAGLVAGIPNLEQAITTRVSTEQGSDTLYRRLGYAPAVGLNIPIVDTEILRLRLSAAVTADPRIAGVTALKLDTNQPDAVIVEMDAQVRGFADPVSISADTAAAIQGA